MRARKSLLVIAAVFVCCTAVWFSVSLYGGQKTYEVEPQITIPEYRTDAARAIDAYERLMERYMDLTERNLFSVGADVRDIVKRLDSIDGKLTDLSGRIARIEKALGIEQPKPAAEKPSQSKALDKKAPDKSSPSP
jgi:hypothetical protein